MRRIFKYPLVLDDEQIIKVKAMPGNTFKEQILCVDTQKDEICLWVMVDDKEPEYSHRVYIRGTGHPCEDDMGKRLEPKDYVGTVKLAGDNLIFHVFIT